MIESYLNDFVVFCDQCLIDIAKNSVFFNSKVKVESVTYEKDFHDAIVEYAFLRLYIKWEYFIEKSFLYFMLGGSGLNGEKSQCYVDPKDEKHAYNLVRGLKQYPDWTNIESIYINANLFFKDGGSFKFLKQEASINEMKKIRNRISHMSIDSSKAFDALVITKLGTCPVPFSVADYLLYFDSQIKVTYFNYYVQSLKAYATKISNP